MIAYRGGRLVVHCDWGGFHHESLRGTPEGETLEGTELPPGWEQRPARLNGLRMQDAHVCGEHRNEVGRTKGVHPSRARRPVSLSPLAAAPPSPN